LWDLIEKKSERERPRLAYASDFGNNAAVKNRKAETTYLKRLDIAEIIV
jgi:hypothetical protein